MPLHFCLQTNEQCCRLLRLTNHSSAYRPVVGLKLNVLFGAGFWQKKNLAPEKYDRLTSFWYHLTGTRNRRLKLALCHHY